MRAVFSDENYLYQSALMETGYMRPFASLTMDDKEEIISILIDYHCLIKPKAAMDQFAEGLQRTGVLHYIKHHHSILRDSFRYRPSTLTAGTYVQIRVIPAHIMSALLLQNHSKNCSVSRTLLMMTGGE